MLYLSKNGDLIEKYIIDDTHLSELAYKEWSKAIVKFIEKLEL